MIDIIMEAYEVVLKEKIPLDKKIKSINFWVIAALGVLIVGLVGVIIFTFRTNAAYAMIAMGVYVVLVYVLTNILIRIIVKRWEDNLKRYNQKLNILKEVLQQNNFDMYEKNKIKQLTKKFNQNIYEMVAADNKKTSDINKFLSLYILPIIAFFAGNIYRGRGEKEMLSVCIVALFIVIMIRILFYSIKSIMLELEGNQLERKRLFAAKLQDLLDRDFEILESDLLQ